MTEIWESKKGFKYDCILAFFIILEQYCTFSIILGGTYSIINIITRGLYSGMVIILPFIVVSIVVAVSEQYISYR